MLWPSVCYIQGMSSLKHLDSVQPISSHSTSSDPRLLSGLVIAKPISHQIQDWINHSEVLTAANNLRTAFAGLNDLEERLHYLNTEVKKLKI